MSHDLEARTDYLITQYVWALENDQSFVIAAKNDVDTASFKKFCSRIHNGTRRLREELEDSFEPHEYSFLYFELWIRFGGFDHLMSALYKNHDVEFNIARLEKGGYKIHRNGVFLINDTPTNSSAKVSFGQPQPCVLAPEPEKEEPMSNTVEIKTITYINNVDVTKLTEEQLIDAIKTIEGEITALKAVKTKSTKITAKIAEAENTLAKVVEVLDAR